MIDPKTLVRAITKAGIRFVTGVPDSTLIEATNCLKHSLRPQNHIGANDASTAIGLAIGYYLAARQPALVYMPGSDLNQVKHILTTPSEPQTVKTPMLLLLSWQENVVSPTQHLKLALLKQQLQTLNIPYHLVDANAKIEHLLRASLSQAQQKLQTVALLVQDNTFAKFNTPRQRHTNRQRINADKAIESLMQVLPEDVAVVASTGKAPHKLFTLRTALSASDSNHTYLTIDGAEQALQIACGIAIQTPRQKVLCLYDDSAVRIQMGNLLLGAKQDNLIHIVINEQSFSASLDLLSFARTSGYTLCLSASNMFEIKASLLEALTHDGSCFINVCTHQETHKHLQEIDKDNVQKKQAYMPILEAMSVQTSHYDRLSSTQA